MYFNVSILFFRRVENTLRPIVLDTKFLYISPFRCLPCPYLQVRGLREKVAALLAERKAQEAARARRGTDPVLKMSHALAQVELLQEKLAAQGNELREARRQLHESERPILTLR